MSGDLTRGSAEVGGALPRASADLTPAGVLADLALGVRGDLPGAAPDVSLLRSIELAVRVLRGMAYEHRLHLLVLLGSGEQTPAELAGAIPLDPTVVAHHLRYLREARLVRRQRRGRNVYYALDGEPTRRLVEAVIRYADRR
jgi:DNA-binding transcriptional ArsR family regulator